MQPKNAATPPRPKSPRLKPPSWLEAWLLVGIPVLVVLGVLALGGALLVKQIFTSPGEVDPFIWIVVVAPALFLLSHDSRRNVRRKRAWLRVACAVALTRRRSPAAMVRVVADFVMAVIRGPRDPA